jgi:hypothetical protein
MSEQEEMRKVAYGAALGRLGLGAARGLGRKLFSGAGTALRKAPAATAKWMRPQGALHSTLRDQVANAGQSLGLNVKNQWYNNLRRHGTAGFRKQMGNNYRRVHKDLNTHNWWQDQLNNEGFTSGASRFLTKTLPGGAVNMFGHPSAVGIGAGSALVSGMTAPGVANRGATEGAAQTLAQFQNLPFAARMGMLFNPSGTIQRAAEHGSTYLPNLSTRLNQILQSRG